MALPTLGEYIAQKIREAIDGALVDSKVLLGEIAKDAAGNVTVNLGTGTGSIIDLITTVVTAVLDPAAVAILDGLSAVEGGGGGLGEGFAFGSLFGLIGSQAITPLTRELYHSIERVFTSQVFDPATLAALAAAGITGDWDPVTDAASGGLRQGHFDGLVEAALSYPDLGLALDMLNRGLILPTDLTLIMERHAIPAVYQPMVAQLARQLLSPADLALATLRGFMDQTAATVYAGTLGVDAADFQTLIDNTGEPPGLETLMMMARRQVIDIPTFEHGVRESRVRDEWIPALEKVFTGPMSVTDAARAVVQHHLDQPTAQQIAFENGLDPSQFPILVENYGRPLSHEQMMELYFRGLVTLDDVDQAFAESDMKDKYSQLAQQLGRKLIAERQIPQMLQYGVLTQDQALAYLMMLGYTQQDSEWLIAFGQAEHHKQLKELTTADITALYEAKAITRPDALAKLEFLGYTRDTSGEFLDLADIKHAASLAKQANTAIKAAFERHDITAQQAISKLKDSGVPDFLAEATVDEWTLSISIATKTLTEAQTVAAAEAGIIGVQEAAARLVSIGYTPTDAVILLEIKGLIKYEPLITTGWKPPTRDEVLDGLK